MPDVIRLLSDHLANQIAAGEVIQRPASAVKELLENAIDAGARSIQLILKDSGKELIQVVDDGSGMSATDARMAFERHATSKIRDIDDLFTIRTMGFRGEALASLAAVAQVEIKTRREEEAVGTRIVIEATQVVTQEPCATPVGTSICAKNLFYNVPARRHFLKSNSTEFRHVVEEFTRVAMANPQVAFRLYHNGVEQFRLEAANSKTRIIELLGSHYEKNLVPLEEDLDALSVQGFIGKPNVSARTRGNQFFFVNGRFVRSPFLNHAVASAYGTLLPAETFPFYVLFLEIDPKRVDVNVHPTKQEVKFEDEKLLYSCLNAAIRHALARYNISPSLDFTTVETEGVDEAIRRRPDAETQARAQSGFLAHSFSQGGRAHAADNSAALDYWKAQFAQAAQEAPEAAPSPALQLHAERETAGGSVGGNREKTVLQVQGSMLLCSVRSGVLLVHIRRAQERILYERLLRLYIDGETPSQQLVFPIALALSPADLVSLETALPDLTKMGFDIAPLGPQAYAIQGVPPDLPSGEEQKVVEEVIERLKNEQADVQTTRTEGIVATVAKRLSHSLPTPQQPESIEALLGELFACSLPEVTPAGKPVSRVLSKEELEGLLG